MIPRGYARTGTTPDGKPGLASVARYASVSMNGAGLDVIVDGVNEMGLGAGLFYFPGSAGYMAYTDSDADKTLAPRELGSWLLENFASVEEARQNIGSVVVPEVVLAAWGFAPEVHYVVGNTTGTSIVLGMPGDFTPPSRFVRAVAFTQSAIPAATGAETVLNAFHILNNFDIPFGSTRVGNKDANGNIQADDTLWTSAADLTTRQCYFRTHENTQIRVVDLMSMDLNAPAIIKIPITDPEVIVPLAPRGQHGSDRERT